MDAAAYQQWWALHVRVARGESLTAGERQAYEVGLEQLHREETLPSYIAALQQVRATVAAVDVERARLQGEREQLDAEIARLEAALSEPVKHLLGIKD